MALSHSWYRYAQGFTILVFETSLADQIGGDMVGTHLLAL